MREYLRYRFSDNDKAQTTLCTLVAIVCAPCAIFLIYFFIFELPKY